MLDFIPGLTLSNHFYQEVVRPILAAEFPELQYSAALIGCGSEVLGFDDEMSSDHDWGPRVQIFLGAADYAAVSEPIREVLRVKLPPEFRGYAIDFLTSVPRPVQLLTAGRLIADYLKFDIDCDAGPADWLTFPQHSLREITSGTIYHDGIDLQAVRDRFAYYPYDVWLYLLMASWARITEEQHLWGRAGFVGDELGSSLMASRLVREIMRLCFLMEQQYAPYPKWFGTAFTRLGCGKALEPILRRAQLAATWQEREEFLCTALEYVGAMHNTLAITEPVAVRAFQFFDRPFRVVGAEAFIAALRARLTDEEVKRIADGHLFGSIDHISDNPNFLMLQGPDVRIRLRELYA